MTGSGGRRVGGTDTGFATFVLIEMQKSDFRSDKTIGMELNDGPRDVT
jgi:hypothetical protein